MWSIMESAVGLGSEWELDCSSLVKFSVKEEGGRVVDRLGKVSSLNADAVVIK
jgi:hypothetical protein